jgi:hypothetical protein
MKKFVLKSLVFLGLITILLSFILLVFGGNVDYFYNKFTTPKQSSLIIGDSRGFQGIQPQVIDKELANAGFELPMMNYCFTIKQAAYGELYTQSILKKLNPKTKNGLFIITVNPWLLAKRNGDNYSQKEFYESNMPPHNMTTVSMNPNVEYLFRNYDYFHFKALFKQKSELHKNGWLEEKNLPKDQKTLTEWTNIQRKMYSGFAQEWKTDTYRLKQLGVLIDSLKSHGQVFLIQTPVDSQIKNIEKNFWPNFDSNMMEVAKQKNVPYFDFSNRDDFQTYDGNHLDKKGGKVFTQLLCDSIKKVVIKR